MQKPRSRAARGGRGTAWRSRLEAGDVKLAESLELDRVAVARVAAMHADGRVLRRPLAVRHLRRREPAVRRLLHLHAPRACARVCLRVSE
eukprot:6194104-Pleurochrysis_carterae.AAC.3